MARTLAPGRALAVGLTGSQRLEGRLLQVSAELPGTHTHRLRPWICVSPRPPRTPFGVLGDPHSGLKSPRDFQSDQQERRARAAPKAPQRRALQKDSPVCTGAPEDHR